MSAPSFRASDPETSRDAAALASLTAPTRVGARLQQSAAPSLSPTLSDDPPPGPRTALAGDYLGGDAA